VSGPARMKPDAIRRALANGFRPPQVDSDSFMKQRAAMCAIGELLMLRDKLRADAQDYGSWSAHLDNAIDELIWLLEQLRK
jgi:hypothetical protein